MNSNKDPSAFTERETICKVRHDVYFLGIEVLWQVGVSICITGGSSLGPEN